MGMEFIESPYFKFNKTLLSWIGLWPYSNSKLSQVQRVVFNVLFATTVMVQLIPFVTKEHSLTMILKVLSYAIIGVLYMVKYNSFLLLANNVKELVEEMESTWIAFTCEEEHKILTRYAAQTKLLVIVLSSLAYCGLILFFVSGFLPDILDFVAPLNESRRQELPILVEHFTDNEEYCYPILLQINLATLIGTTTFISTEMFNAMFIGRIASLFEISCYRISNLVDENVLHYPPSQRSILICGRIVNAIICYQKAIKMSESFSSTFMTSYFALLVLGVASLSMNLFRFSQVLLTVDKIEDLTFDISLMISAFIYLYYCNYLGQTLTDHSAEIFGKLYETPWTVLPLPARKLLLLFMQRALKSFTLVPGGIFVASLKGFSTISDLSFSYFMLFYSVQ